MLYISNNKGKLRVVKLETGEIIKDIKISRDSLSKPFIYKKKLFIIKNGAIVQYE